MVRASGVVRGRWDGSSFRAARPALPAEMVAATVLSAELLLGSALSTEDRVRADGLFARPAVTSSSGGPARV